MKIKRILTTIIVSVICLGILTFYGCKEGGDISVTPTPDTNTTDDSEVSATPVTDTSVEAKEAEGDFTITTEDGKYTKNDNIYTITSAGTYVLSGNLEGQITVDAGDNDTVILELSGVTISYSKDSPVKISNADKAEISAKADTENVIKDTRSPGSTGGAGAVYADCDLKIKGTGTLVVTGECNNGIHTTKDLTIQKLSLKSTAYNNALKGNDSVTIKSGTIIAISTNGDGIETQNTDSDTYGNVRGDIIITGGAVAVYAAGDAIQAAHNFEMKKDEEGNAAALTIYTGSYSGYTASSATTTSYKGIKVQNELNISSGNLDIKSYDDGLHADYGTSLTAGGKGQGTINISGGTITISVYSPSGSTGGGQMGPSGGRMGPPGGWGWSGQKTVSGADGIHADYKLNISGGIINVDSAYEGLEANVITISGGKTYVSANDDGVNATKGNSASQVLVTGGYLDVTVSPNGDTDGIDSNGTYTQTGGIVITRGPRSEMAAALDADGAKTISGGTLIILGYGRVSTSGSVKSYSLSLHSSGTHTVTVDGTEYTFNNSNSYASTTCFSSVPVSA